MLPLWEFTLLYMGKPSIHHSWPANKGAVCNQPLCDRMGQLPIEHWAERSGVDKDTLARIVYLCTSPFTGNEPPTVGMYTPEALRIAEALGTAPEDIFPSSLYVTGPADEDGLPVTDTSRVPVSASIFYAGREQDPHRDLEHAELLRVLHWALSTLPNRQHQVVAYLYGLEGEGEHSVRECAEKFGITPTTVKYIEYEVRRKFRHPTRSRWIRRAAYLPQEDPEPLARLAG